VTFDALARRLMINDVTNGKRTTGTFAGIFATKIEARQARGTLRIGGALWSAHRRSSYGVFETRTDGNSLGALATLRVRTAW
jgi:hypothetical protein